MGKPLDRRIRNREYDARRRQEKPWRHLYKTGRWQAIRTQQLSQEPLCKRCKDKGLIVVATVVHHVERHNGDAVKFFSGPFASSCAPCHDILEQKIERAGYEIGVDGTGRPLASDHPWNGGLGLQPSAIGTAKSHPRWFRPSLIPLTIVCGPPASGKSTFVRQNALRSDRIVCFDLISQSLFGRSAGGQRAHAALSSEQVGDVLRERNEMLADLMWASAKSKWRAAWLIVSEPRAEYRQWWVDKVGASRVVVIATPAEVCKQRASRDAEGGDKRHTTVNHTIDRWWSDYTKRESDETIINSDG